MAGSEITELLIASQAGNADAEAKLLAFIYDDLRRMAARRLTSEGADCSLSATALVNEAYLRLLGESKVDFNDRQHFFRLIGRAMRNIAVDHARARLAQKRGGDVHTVSIEEELLPDPGQAQLILDVGDLLERLAEIDERMVRVVEYRFFVGLTEAETAEALGISRPTVSRDWDKARAILREMLEE